MPDGDWTGDVDPGRSQGGQLRGAGRIRPMVHPSCLMNWDVRPMSWRSWTTVNCPGRRNGNQSRSGSLNTGARPNRPGRGPGRVRAGRQRYLVFFLLRNRTASAEDGYAIHCCTRKCSITVEKETDIDQDAGEYAGLLQQWHGPPLTNAVLLHLAEISPQLHYPQRLVGVASASLNGEPGWVVLDGERSEWFPRADQLGENDATAVLRIHVGGRLLGLTGKRDRKPSLHRQGQPPNCRSRLLPRMRIYWPGRSSSRKSSGTARRRSLTPALDRSGRTWKNTPMPWSRWVEPAELRFRCLNCCGRIGIMLPASAR